MFEKYMHQDIEQELLSRIISKQERLFNCPDLQEKHFIFEEHKKIFSAISELSCKNIPITPKGIYDLVGNAEYIAQLTAMFSPRNEKDLAKYLIEESEKYNALVEMKNLLDKAEEDKNTDVFASIDKIATRDSVSSEVVSDEQMLKELEERMKKGLVGIKTNISNLDDNINAFQKGRLYIVGARPSVGKSAFMCSLVENIEKKEKVGILSLEMNTCEIKQRLACLRSNIKHWKIEKGKCNSDEFDEYASALMSIKNVVINDRGGLNRFQVSSIIKNMVVKEKCKIIFIDHLGLIKADAKNNLAHEIGETTSMLKALSKELSIPIVVLCQINRAVEKQTNKEPSLSDLRDSGRIEEDADCVIFLYRDNYYDENGTGQAKYIVAKCRNGKTGRVNGFFEKELMKWT